MREVAQPARRTFVGSLGWAMGAVGIAGVSYTLLQSIQDPAAFDPRVRVTLPEQAEGFFKTFKVLGRPVGVRGLTNSDKALLSLLPIAPSFLVLDLVCTKAGEGCAVARQLGDDVNGPSETRWMCPCCGTDYSLAGRPIQGPAKQNLAVPPYRFEGARTLLIGGINAPV